MYIKSINEDDGVMVAKQGNIEFQVYLKNVRDEKVKVIGTYLDDKDCLSIVQKGSFWGDMIMEAMKRKSDIFTVDEMPQKGRFVAVWNYQDKIWSSVFAFIDGVLHEYNDEDCRFTIISHGVPNTDLFAQTKYLVLGRDL